MPEELLSCPHCHCHFTAEEAEKVMQEEKKNQLKEKFVKLYGWEARGKKLTRRVLFGVISPLFFFYIPSALILVKIVKNPNPEWALWLFLATLVLMVIAALIGARVENRFSRNEDEAFEEWFATSGV